MVLAVLTWFSFSIEAASSLNSAAAARSATCFSLVALAIGAVTPGCASSHASATRAGVDPAALGRGGPSRLGYPGQPPPPGETPVLQVFLNRAPACRLLRVLRTAVFSR